MEAYDKRWKKEAIKRLRCLEADEKISRPNRIRLNAWIIALSASKEELPLLVDVMIPEVKILNRGKKAELPDTGRTAHSEVNKSAVDAVYDVINMAKQANKPQVNGGEADGTSDSNSESGC
jgi:hypothetical protein